MKLSLQYTNNIDREYIKEAAQLKNIGEAEKKGWTFIGNGAYKRSYKKGNVVVKFNRQPSYYLDHMLNEVKFYKNAPRKYKKYLARIFGGNKSKIIQKFVNVDKQYIYSDNDRSEIYALAETMGISDPQIGENVAKAKNKKICFFDFAGHCQ